jgi:hypothetical protein
MCVVGFRIQVLLNPSSTSQFIELPPLLLFYRLAEEDNRRTSRRGEREMLARECFDPAASSLIAIELETTPKAPNANSQRRPCLLSLPPRNNRASALFIKTDRLCALADCRLGRLA